LNPQIEEKMFLKVITIGYRSIETDFFNFKKENNLKFEFYLTEDNRPIYNCESVLS